MLNVESFAGAIGIFSLGFTLGLKHATEVDHIVAVTTIVSEQRKVFRSAIVGGLWGLGHTAALLVVGVFVLALQIAIPVSVSDWLEFTVALMIIALGTSALLRLFRKRNDFHLHRHSHNGIAHTHVHYHNSETEKTHSVEHSHAVSAIGLKPMLVGLVHGLAGSAALMLLILARIKSPLLGAAFLGLFGLGSILSMLLMSCLIGLPFMFTSRRFATVHYRLQVFAGVVSIVFGLWYAYQSILPALS